MLHNLPQHVCYKLGRNWSPALKTINRKYLTSIFQLTAVNVCDGRREKKMKGRSFYLAISAIGVMLCFRVVAGFAFLEQFGSLG